MPVHDIWARRAVDAKPDRIPDRARLVHLLLLDGELEIATREAQAALQIAPDDPTIGRWLNEIGLMTEKHAHWMNYHLGLCETNSAFRPRILFIGDSITAGWMIAGRSAWERYFAPLRAAQIGIAGDTTKMVSWRLDNGALEGIRPQVVLLMIGTNDLSLRVCPESLGRVA